MSKLRVELYDEDGNFLGHAYADAESTEEKPEPKALTVLGSPQPGVATLRYEEGEINMPVMAPYEPARGDLVVVDWRSGFVLGKVTPATEKRPK